MVFHVLNRGVGRMKLFLKEADFEAFERVIEQTLETRSMRILAYCLMSNHWHLVLWPEHDGDLGAFMQKLTITHARNWQINRARVGYGHLYQGRYKSFPVENDEHFYQVVRYVERNALRANMVRRAEDWRYSSLWRRRNGTTAERKLLSDWPLARPRSWLQYVNQPQSEAELKAIRRSVVRGQPYGGDAWVRATAVRLGLESTLRPRGRPKTENDDA
ncbi:MAG TPA: transposase [Pirellulales bacterium]|nr:transposase [Pirellulales bacterium]